MSRLVFSATILIFSICSPNPVIGTTLPIHLIKLPPGFVIELFADDLPDARSMALGDRGTLFVGTRTRGRVYAVVDRDRDYRADQVFTIASGLFMPNGVAFRSGSLYVAEVNRILCYENIEDHLDDPGLPRIITDTLPDDEHHGWKFIRFGPDNRLYVPVGAPCNICEPDLPYAAIHRMNPDGSGFETFARGVRNTVGFDWHPLSGEMWFTDNGRDWLGDDLPPDELNRAPEKGMHFGYPYRHGREIVDPQFGTLGAGKEFTPPAQELGAHVAALGMRFYTGTMFPEEYRNQIFIAEHGSWNRSSPVGYQVSLVRLEGDRAVGYEPFATGWLQKGGGWGRPVDLLVLADGSMLVSDDRRGAIYRIRYAGEGK